MMPTAERHNARGATCTSCGSPLDTLYFDAVNFQNAPPQPDLLVVVRLELPRQYCGVLEGFQQFVTPGLAPGQVETPGIEWLLRANDRPLDPYIGFRAIVNPWGEAANRIAVNLEEGTVLEMIARFAVGAEGARIGGRLMGRYWFDDQYGRSRPR